jgi:hypothetical protein
VILLRAKCIYDSIDPVALQGCASDLRESRACRARMWAFPGPSPHGATWPPRKAMLDVWGEFLVHNFVREKHCILVGFFAKPPELILK